MARYLLVFVLGLALGLALGLFVPRGDEGPPPGPARVDAPVPPVAQAPLPGAPAPVPVAPPPTAPEDGALVIPVAGIRAGDLIDTFTQSRGAGRSHDAIDIMAAAGTPVLAAVDGPVVKLFTSERGGLTVYQFDQAGRRVYYYAHLQGYAPGLAEGQVLRRGEVLGTVGSTGNASPDGPHLHFAVSDLGPEGEWWRSTPVNPYPLLVGGRGQ